MNITLTIANLKKLISRLVPIAAKFPDRSGLRPLDATELRTVAGGDGNSTGPHLHFGP